MILANICSRGLLIISGSCAVGNANNTHKTHETFQCCSLKNISSLWALFHYLYVVSSNSTEFASYLYGLTLNSFRIYHHIVDDHKQGKGTRFDKHNHWDLTSILFITRQWSFCCCWCCNIFFIISIPSTVHFTVACLVAKPFIRSEAKGDLVMIQILLLSNVNCLVVMLTRYWSLSKQGHLHPHSKFKDWQLSTQL